MSNKIVIERVYSAPIEMIWKALTETDQLKQWYFDFKDFDLEVGKSFDWLAGPPDGEQWLHRGVMMEIVPGTKLSHSWEYPGYSGSSILTWELSAIDSDKTKLILTHEFTIPFDPAVDALKRENFVEGWNGILSVGLVNYLQKQTVK